MWYIGVTGGVGSGKSRVLSYLEQNYNCTVLRSDDLAREMMQRGGVLRQVYVQVLGTDILTPDGEIDRQKTASVLFRDPAMLEEINRRTHPLVSEEIERRRIRAEKENREFFFLESAVLIEEKYNEICDELWYVYADENSRRARLKQQRGYTDERISDMLKNQQRESVFRSVCDFTVDNSGDFDRTAEAVDRHIRELEMRCAAVKKGQRGRI